VKVGCGIFKLYPERSEGSPVAQPLRSFSRWPLLHRRSFGTFGASG